jgi:uncharacterized protein
MANNSKPMLKKIILFFSFALMAVIAVSQQLPPKPATLVTDYTNTLSESDRQLLEKKLVAFNDSTSTQIAVVLIKSTGQYDINDYAVKLGRAWGVGQKDKNNGIVILVAITDHKVSIQTGYGAEGAVPDATTSEIIQNDITPRFKAGDYYGGLDAATTDLMKSLRGEYKAAPVNDNSSAGGGIFILIFIVVIVLIIIFRGRGGGGQIYGGRGAASPFWWFLGGSMLGRGSSSGWGGGNSGGGGGFGGFEGGSFGGGGSSGSW